jgi:hypothetical protein
MPQQERDLLVLAHKSVMSPDGFWRQVAQLNKILSPIEGTQAFCKCVEVIDVNRFKKITKPHLLQSILKQEPLKPFVFVIVKN